MTVQLESLVESVRFIRVFKWIPWCLCDPQASVTLLLSSSATAWTFGLINYIDTVVHV